MASEVLKKEGIMIAKVDASKEAELAKEHMIQGFPTLSVFKKGVKFEDFSGERTADAIIAYMRKLNDPNWAPPPSAVVTLTADNFTKFVKNEKLSLAMWYAPWCKHCKQVMPGKTMHCTIHLVAVGSSRVLKGKQKLGITFNSDNLGGIDFTNFSKLTMCSA